jgi:hypothetical protein
MAQKFTDPYPVPDPEHCLKAITRNFFLGIFLLSPSVRFLYSNLLLWCSDLKLQDSCKGGAGGPSTSAAAAAAETTGGGSLFQDMMDNFR